MLCIQFKIQNLFIRQKSGNNVTKHFIDIYHKLSKNKFFEVELLKWYPDTLFQIVLDTSWNGHDHAGPSLILEILGFYFKIGMYDNRHWDWKLGQWELVSDDPDNY